MNIRLFILFLAFLASPCWAQMGGGINNGIGISSSGGGGSGTVTSVSVVSANGLTGTVANPTTTPAITLSTTATGLLQGNGTAISAATLPLGTGLTITPGMANATPFAAGDTIYNQVFPNTFTGSHTVSSTESSGLDIMNSTSNFTFSLPQAGTTGFEDGVAYSFLDINTGTATISTTTSVFNGMVLTSSNIVLSQYGFATCVSDGTNWNCSGIGNPSSGGGDTITTPNSTLTVGGTSTNTTLDINLNNPNTWTKGQRVTPVTDSISTATFTPDLNASNHHNITLVHASCPCTLANPTNITAGEQGQIVINQSATGSDLISTYGTDYVFTSLAPPILSTAASAQDIFSYYVVDSTHIRVSFLPANGPVSYAATLTAGTNVTSCTCTSAACTNLRGTVTIVGGTATTGTVCSPSWTATPAAYVCTATMNGGATSFAIGNSVATTTGFNITTAVSIAASTAIVNYSCQP
jgi:hypothetical protein